MRLSRKNFTEYIGLKGMSPVVRILTMSDIIFMSGLGLVTPIFAVFITDQIPGGSLEVVGIAATIFLITKSLGQLIVAEVVDKIKGEFDDFWSMLIGSIFISLVQIAYIFIDSTWQLYTVQVVYGLATAMTFPSWMAIFTRHIDKKREGMEWGVYFTSTDLMGAIAAGLGGYFAEHMGFDAVFSVTAMLSFAGTAYLAFVYRYLRPARS